MVARLVIHAGLPKTGTKYLQTCFAENEEWLHRQGVCYPRVGREPLHGHHSIARELQAGNAGMLTKVMEEAQSSLRTSDPIILLSSEEFSTLRAQQLRVLRQHFATSEIVWVLYLRRRSSVFLSRWQENIKHGLADSMYEFLASEVLGNGDVLRPEVALTVAGNVLGAKALRIVLYDRIVADGQELFSNFMSCVLDRPLDREASVPASRLNVGLDMPVCETLRAINCAAAKGGRHAPGGRRFAAQALIYLQNSSSGGDLLRRVVQVFEEHAAICDLGELDRIWKHIDREIQAACRGQFVNFGDGDLFVEAEASAVTVRCIRPSLLLEFVSPTLFVTASNTIEEILRLRGPQ